MRSTMSLCAEGLCCHLTLFHRDWPVLETRVAVGVEMGYLVDVGGPLSRPQISPQTDRTSEHLNDPTDPQL